MQMTDFTGPEPRKRLSAATIKMAGIIALALLLLIPSGMIQGLIDERASRQMDTVNEISSKWGNSQTVIGPVLTVPCGIPYVYRVDPENRDNKEIRYNTVNMHFLPEELSIKGLVFPETRYRGIYEAAVYNSALEVQGFFDNLDFSRIKSEKGKIHWDRAFISMGLSDMRGLTKRIEVRFGDKKVPISAGAGAVSLITNGVSGNVSLDEATPKHHFSFKLDFNGSQSLKFAPLGKTTTIGLESSWQSPSFTGAFLPDKRKVTDQGFEASWHILDLNRNIPQQWKGETYERRDLKGSIFGVSLITQADAYQKSTRTAKYAILFIAITFAGFFLCEVIMMIRIHPVQYILVGLGITVFYVLLIAASEHISFGWSYLASAAATTCLLSAYSASALRSKKLAAAVAAAYSILYAYLYVTLQQEDYALLSGSIGLFVLLAVIMFATRKIDWYSLDM